MIFDDLKALPKLEPFLSDANWYEGLGHFGSANIGYCDPITYETYIKEYEPMVAARGLTHEVRSEVGHRIGRHFEEFFAPLHPVVLKRGNIKFCCAGYNWRGSEEEPPNAQRLYLWCGVRLNPLYTEDENRRVEFSTLFCDLDDLSATSWIGILEALESAAAEAVPITLKKIADEQRERARKLAQAHEQKAAALDAAVSTFRCSH